MRQLAVLSALRAELTLVGQGMLRLLVGVALGLALVLLGAALPLILLLGRRSYAGEIGSACSCLLNAASGGPRTCTFSAWSWELALRAAALGLVRVRWVDRVNRQPGHCEDAWQNHRLRGLLAAAEPRP